MVEALATIIIIVLMFVPVFNVLVGVIAGGFVGGAGGAFVGGLIGVLITWKYARGSQDTPPIPVFRGVTEPPLTRMNGPCPFCAEPINLKSEVCPHCHKELYPEVYNSFRYRRERDGSVVMASSKGARHFKTWPEFWSVVNEPRERAQP